jgi:hypothetical protein
VDGDTGDAGRAGGAAAVTVVGVTASAVGLFQGGQLAESGVGLVLALADILANSRADMLYIVVGCGQCDAERDDGHQAESNRRQGDILVCLVTRVVVYVLQRHVGLLTAREGKLQGEYKKW